MDNGRCYCLFDSCILEVFEKTGKFLPEIKSFYWNSIFFPSNLPEKLLINSIAPGGVGAILAEKYVEKVLNKNLAGLKKYLIRTLGSISLTSIWASIQYLGYRLSEIYNIQTPYGGNPFESPNVYPINLLIAGTSAVVATYGIDKLASYLKNIRKIKRRITPATKEKKESEDSIKNWPVIGTTRLVWEVKSGKATGLFDSNK